RPDAGHHGNPGATHLELMRPAEEPDHSRHSTRAPFSLDPRELPHDTSRRHPYRPSHQCRVTGPWKEKTCGGLTVRIRRTARFTSPARTTTTLFRPSRRTRRRHTRI